MSLISIIIPTLNEAKNLPKTLQKIQGERREEIIVVDGGSEDETVQIANSFGVKTIHSSQRCRSYQMNLGAAAARGNILLFLHGDTQLPPNYLPLIQEALASPQTAAGAFELAIDAPEKSLRLIEKIVNWRSRFLALPYGDQAIFLKADLFREIGGFTNLPILEDFDLVRRLQRQGKIYLVPAKVLTSGRRWQKLGVCRTTAINQAIVLGYYLGVPVAELARWYGRK